MLYSIRRAVLVLFMVAATMVLLCSTPGVNAFAPSVARGSTSSALAMAATETDDSKVETFRKTDFIASVAEKTGLSKKESEEALKAVLDTLQEQVGAGKRVNLPGFGTFTLRERAARKGRNPRTGEDLTIAASKSPGFSAAKAWKDAGKFLIVLRSLYCHFVVPNGNDINAVLLHTSILRVVNGKKEK